MSGEGATSGAAPTAGGAGTSAEVAGAGDALARGATTLGDPTAPWDAAAAGEKAGLGHRLLSAAGGMLGPALGLCAAVGTKPTTVMALTSSAARTLALAVSIVVIASVSSNGT
jgi:hypothetical protein